MAIIIACFPDNGVPTGVSEPGRLSQKEVGNVDDLPPRWGWSEWSHGLYVLGDMGVWVGGGEFCFDLGRRSSVDGPRSGLDNEGKYKLATYKQ